MDGTEKVFYLTALSFVKITSIDTLVKYVKKHWRNTMTGRMVCSEKSQYQRHSLYQ